MFLNFTGVLASGIQYFFYFKEPFLLNSIINYFDSKKITAAAIMTTITITHRDLHAAITVVVLVAINTAAKAISAN